MVCRKETMNQEALETLAKDFVLAKVDGKLTRYHSSEHVPVDAQVDVITAASLESMSDEDLGKLYGTIAGVNPKIFKERRVAISSIVYQIAKMRSVGAPAPEFPDEPHTEVRRTANKPSSNAGVVTKATTATSKRAVGGSSFQIVPGPHVEGALIKMPAQCIEVYSILVDLSTKVGVTVTHAAIVEAFAAPGMAERLKTRQEPIRIFAYYKSKLIDSGLIKTC